VHSIDLAAGIRSVVLVEGVSDVAAIETIAARREQSLEQVAVVALGGATNVRNAVVQLDGMRVSGLCDRGEQRFFARVLETFFVCDSDLEDEFIRALGVGGVEGVIEKLGDLPAFRTFQNQPFQRSRSHEQQLHRFMGTMSGRKEQYGRALAETGVVPPPIAALLEWCR
jgi:hypothetical protein